MRHQIHALTLVEATASSVCLAILASNHFAGPREDRRLVDGPCPSGDLLGHLDLHLTTMDVAIISVVLSNVTPDGAGLPPLVHPRLQLLPPLHRMKAMLAMALLASMQGLLAIGC